MSVLRIAVIGAGGVAARHVRVLSGFDDARVVAVADPVAAAAEALAASCGATAYQDAGQLLDRERVDAVYVCVPPFAHGDPERAVLARGLPLFVEKPLAADLGTAERAGRGGGERRRGHRHRLPLALPGHRPSTPAALLADAPARLALGSWLDKVPPPAWWPSRALSGGQVVEQLTHVVDLARALVGEIEEVHCGRLPDGLLAGRRRRRHRRHRSASAAARSARSPPARCCRPSTPPRCGRSRPAGWCSTCPRPSWSSSATASGGRSRPAVDGHVAVDREFLDAVTGRRDVTRVPYAEALATHRVACALADLGGHRRAGRSPDGRGAGMTERLILPEPGQGRAGDPSRTPSWPTARSGSPPRTPGLSAGTELSWFKGTNPFLGRSFDRELGLFADGEPTSPYPVTRVGYMESGRVVREPGGRAAGRDAGGGRVRARHRVRRGPGDRARRAAAGRPRPGARRVRRAHGPDLRERPAARRRRRGSGDGARRSPTVSPAAGCWSPAPA